MQTFLLHTEASWIDAALLLGRVFIGICFVVHALGKLGLVGKGNMAGFTGWLKSLGVPFAEAQARLAMANELIGGSLVAVGLFTRVGALLCLLTMVVAASIGHRGGGYLITNTPPGNEYTINLGVVMLMFLLMGPGAYSLDAWIFG
ncbi:MAG TPA: DoxX family protein [Bdellovibrionota bacterium]|nr:DoxX family protein [Bdellovibrionota bacterium]